MRKIIKRRLNKQCVICGKTAHVKVYKDTTYRGGHYFGKVVGKAEYWECPKCYWG